MGIHDQNLVENHALCWSDCHPSGPTIWFDNGEPCIHHEWHGESA